MHDEPGSIAVLQAVTKRSHEFSNQLRSVDDSSVQVPGLEWTVADLGQHLAGMRHYWTSHHEQGADFERPDDFAAFSEAARAHISETDPSVLADLVDAEFASFTHDLATNPDKRWLYGSPTDPILICGLALSELVIHGRDLAAVTGVSPPEFSREEANRAVDGMVAVSPFFVDPVRAQGQPDGVYHVRFFGGNDYTWTKQGATLSIELGRPKRADARMAADPATFIYSSLGRIGQARAALSGKFFAYGRRPWRLAGLSSITVDGV